MKTNAVTIAVITFVWLGAARLARAETYGIETLDLNYVEQGWGSPHANQSVEGHGLSIGGRQFEHGLGTHAQGTFRISLGGKAERFTALVGVDDEVGKSGSVEFKVVGDGKTLWESGVMRGGEQAKEVAVELRGIKELSLIVTDAGDDYNMDHADWTDARFVMAEGKPEALVPAREPALVLTPKASPRPRINGPKVFGVRPGAPVLFAIPASGQAPMKYSARKLPAGLSLDPNTGRITGTLTQRGTHVVTLSAQNSLGKAERALKIVFTPHGQ